MGGFFGIASEEDCVLQVFFGTDYHSHLGTHRAGMAAYSEQEGFLRDIHNIENSPFRTRFAGISEEMKGKLCIGCISDLEPQPLLVRSKLGVFAICMVGVVNNAKQLAAEVLGDGKSHFEAMSGGRINSVEVLAAMISQCDDFASGIRYAQQRIEGSASILIMTERSLIVARDLLGRTPVHIGKNDSGRCVSFESFAYQKLGFTDERELGPGEVVEVRSHGITQLLPPGDKMRICAFLWTYFGYPNSSYEGSNVEVMRNRNGELLCELQAQTDTVPDVDSVSGVPDSGTAYAVGYANKSDLPFTRPFIKYTPTWPRSFTPASQAERDMVAKMKIIPVHDLIQGKRLLLIDDSIVRGTQLRETVEFLYKNGAKEVHMRSACPPYMYSCKYLNFSRTTSDLELLARRVILELEGEEGFQHLEEYSDGTTERGKRMRKAICDKFGFASLDYQSIDNLLASIDVDPCKVCTYCWTGKE